MNETNGPPRDYAKDIDEIRRALAAQAGLPADKSSMGEITIVLEKRGRFVEERMASGAWWGTTIWGAVAVPIGAVLTLAAQAIYHAVFGGKGP